MADEIITKTDLEGVLLVNRPTISDERGFFHEVVRKNELEEALGFKLDFVQINHSHSAKGILRGIHAAPWTKLLYVPKGEIQLVVSDLRADSPTFGEYFSVIIGDRNKIAVFLPVGVGNSFLILSEEADVVYFAGDYWQAGKEVGVIWNDPDLNIKWEDQNPILSEKDLQNRTLRETFPDKFQTK